MHRLVLAATAVIGLLVPAGLLPIVISAPSATQQAFCVLIGTPPPVQGTTTVCTPHSPT